MARVGPCREGLDVGVDVVFVAPHQEGGDPLHRPLGRREADPLHPPLAQRIEPFERECQVRTALVADQGVDFVDDHGLDRGQPFASPRAGQQQIQRLRGGHEDVRRLANEAGPFACRGVACPQANPQRRQIEPLGGGDLADLGQGDLEIAVHVIRQCPQGREVDHPQFLGQPPLEPLAQQAVDRREKGGEGFPRAGRGGNQRVLAPGNRRPALGLGFRRPGEPAEEPVTNHRQEEVEGHGVAQVDDDVVQAKHAGAAEMRSEERPAAHPPGADWNPGQTRSGAARQ